MPPKSNTFLPMTLTLAQWCKSKFPLVSTHDIHHWHIIVYQMWFFSVKGIFFLNSTYCVPYQVNHNCKCWEEIMLTFSFTSDHPSWEMSSHSTIPLIENLSLIAASIILPLACHSNTYRRVTSGCQTKGRCLFSGDGLHHGVLGMENPDDRERSG